MLEQPEDREDNEKKYRPVGKREHEADTLIKANACRNRARTEGFDFSCRVNECSGSRLCYAALWLPRVLAEQSPRRLDCPVVEFVGIQEFGIKYGLKIAL